jgi:hypothetical protein
MTIKEGIPTEEERDNLSIKVPQDDEEESFVSSASAMLEPYIEDKEKYDEIIPPIY